jgi:hypothetical protein
MTPPDSSKGMGPRLDERAVEAALRAQFPEDYDTWPRDEREEWHADFRRAIAAYFAALDREALENRVVFDAIRVPLPEHDAKDGDFSRARLVLAALGLFNPTEEHDACC